MDSGLKWLIDIFVLIDAIIITGIVWVKLFPYKAWPLILILIILIVLFFHIAGKKGSKKKEPADSFLLRFQR